MGRSLQLILVLLIIASCADKPQYKQKVSMEQPYWYYNNSASFDIDITDTIQHYDIILDVDHSPEYAAQNLYIKIETTYPDDVTKEQVLSMEMADLSGKWYGDCNSKHCQLSLLLQERARFNQLGSHKIEISQHSRQDSLTGINALTLSLFSTPK